MDRSGTRRRAAISNNQAAGYQISRQSKFKRQARVGNSWAMWYQISRQIKSSKQAKVRIPGNRSREQAEAKSKGEPGHTLANRNRRSGLGVTGTS